MKSKTWLVMVLLVLLPVVLSAEGNKEESANGENVKFTAVFDRIILAEDGRDEWVNKFNELTGTTIDVTQPAHNQYSQIVSTMFAAGDAPDILELQTNDYLAFAKSGNLLPIEDYIDSSDVLKSVDKDLLEAYRLNDGHIYAVPMYNGGGCVTYIRQDWLDNLGLKAPKNWDEYYKVLKAFTFDDPDGNGKNDTVGITLPFQTGYEFDYYNRMLMQDAWFGWDRKGSKWVDGFTQPAMFNAVARIKSLYDEGILDNEFFTNKTSTARSKVISGQSGVMEYWSGIWAQRFDDRAKAQNPKAVISALEPIENAYYINRVGPVFAITSGAKNPEVIFDSVVNTMLDKGAGQTLFTYGVEGLHYQIKDGVHSMLPLPSNPEALVTKAYSDPSLIMNGWEPLVKPATIISQSQKVQKDNGVQLFLPEGDVMFTKRNGEILSLKQEIFAEMIVGTLTIEEGLAEYKKKANALGLQEVIAELNK
ncbi:MAG: extracellular solute-binding protein [Spirochaetaceae bacterium]